MITFESIRYKNILSTGDYWQEHDLQGTPLTLIIGKNGAGKTTLIDALFFALYGEAFRDIVKKKLLNSKNKKALLVELWFKSGPNRYFIRRGIKPDVFEFYVNDSLVPMDAKKVDYQLNVNKAVRIDKKSLKSQVTLASRSYVPFMRMTAPDRRTVVQDVLDIQVFTEMSKIGKGLSDALKAELTDIDHDMKELGHRMALERSRVTVKADTLRDSIEALEKRNVVLESEIEHLEGDVQTLNAECVDLTSQMAQMRDLSRTVSTNRALKSTLEDQYKLVTDDKKFYCQNDSCPTCQQAIDAGFKATAIEELSVKRQSIVERGTVLKDQINKDVDLMDSLEVSIKELQTKQNKAQVKTSEIRMKRNTIRQNAEEIKKLSTPTESETIIESKINEYQAEYNELARQKASKSSELDLLKVAALMLKDEGIKTQIVKKYLPTINATINKFIRMLGFNATFEMNETFEENIKDEYGESFSYHSYSEGEKMRFDLAILFTWREIAKLRNTTDTNLLIMDEVLDASLDTDGAEDFMKVISQIVQNTNTFVISHNADKIKDRFDKVIEFKKVKKFSQMKVVKQ